jgi:hypothetical protein
MPEPRPRLVSLTDDQLGFVLQITAPLDPVDRVAFLEALAVRLRDEPELGDGLVFRCARELLPRFFRPPVMSTAHSPRRNVGAPLP